MVTSDSVGGVVTTNVIFFVKVMDGNWVPLGSCSQFLLGSHNLVITLTF